MKHFQDDVSFEVRWLPFQLNPQASKTGISKVPITPLPAVAPFNAVAVLQGQDVSRQVRQKRARSFRDG